MLLDSANRTKILFCIIPFIPLIKPIFSPFKLTFSLFITSLFSLMANTGHMARINTIIPKISVILAKPSFSKVGPWLRLTTPMITPIKSAMLVILTLSLLSEVISGASARTGWYITRLNTVMARYKNEKYTVLRELIPMTTGGLEIIMVAMAVTIAPTNM